MSSKTFGKVLKIGAAVFLIGATMGIGALLVGGVGLSTALALPAIGGLGLGTIAALSFTAYQVGNSLAHPPGMPSATGAGIAARLSISSDPIAPRAVLVGKVGVSGTLRYRNVMTLNGKQVSWMVLALGGYPVDSLDSFYLNGNLVTIESDGSVATGPYAGKLWVYFRNGRGTSAAFTEINTDETAAGVVNPKWGTNTRVGRGIPAVAIKAITDDVFNGQLAPMFVIKGARVYDPRKDTTVGGSGSHRWNDETTHEWSRNPSLIKLAYLRGFWWNDSASNAQLIAGRGILNDVSLAGDMAHWIAQANICDETVGVVGGGTIPRYTADGIIDPTGTHRDVLRSLDTADGGSTYFAAGMYRSYPAAYRAATLTFTEKDIIGAPTRVDLRRGPKDRINVVRGTFADASNGYQARDYPSVKDNTSISLVGEKQATLDFPFTTDHRTAQRLAKISMRQQNAGRGMQARYTHRALKVAPGGENIAQTYTMYGFTAQQMRITNWTCQPLADGEGVPGIGVDMTLVMDDSTYYSWTAGTDEQALDAPDLLPPTSARPVPGQSYALVINVNATGGANSGEAAIVGVNSTGDADYTKDGYIRWNGSRINIPRNNANSATVSTQIAAKRGLIVFDTAKPGTPRFTVSGNGVHTAFCWREAGIWYYDKNDGTTATFTPIQNRDVALGWLETAAADVIGDGGLYGQPLPLEFAAENDAPDFSWTPLMTNTIRRGATFVKVAGTAATWDSDFHSLETYDAAFIDGGVTSTSNAVMLGLSSSPGADANYTSIDHAIYQNGSTDYRIYESGALIATLSTTPAVGDRMRVVYDGQLVQYFINGALVWKTPRFGARLGADSSINNSGGSIGGVVFGPIGNQRYVLDDLRDDFAYLNTTDFNQLWEEVTSSGEISFLTGLTDSPAGTAIRCGNNAGNDQVWKSLKKLMPYDGVSLYEVGAVVRKNSGSGFFYCGLEGVAADGVTLINGSGSNSHGSQHYAAANNATPGAGWTVYRGYLKGWSSSPGAVSAAANDSSAPSTMRTNVTYVRPMFLVNYSGASGQMDVAAVWVRRLGGALVAKDQADTPELVSEAVSSDFLFSDTDGVAYSNIA